ncbi:unnamed protein product, partial [Rotaria magnacalcarata]
MGLSNSRRWWRVEEVSTVHLSSTENTDLKTSQDEKDEKIDE